jgi:hypothetical protein
MPGEDKPVLIDMNNTAFQRDLFALEKNLRHAALNTLQRISRLTWTQVYRDSGLKWERIHSVGSKTESRAVYSLRFTQGRRMTANREGNVLCLLSIPPDHDSTYKP